MKNKITLLNTVSCILLQLVNIASNFIIPQLILSTFGSEVNGLVSSLTQFLNYIALLEGGVNGVIMANLYRPLFKKDYKTVSSIIKTSTNFFRKISLLFAIYTIVLAIIYPIIVNSNFSFAYISSLTIILSIKLFTQYCFSLSIKNLLNADKKVFYVSITQIVLVIIDTLSAIIICKCFPDIHILKIASALIFTLQPILYTRYAKKHYSLEKKVPVNKKLIASRWNGFAINFAAFIHNSTDLTIITFVIGLTEASVYSVYALITTGIKQVINSIWNAFSPSMGNTLASGNIKNLNEKFDMLEYINFILTFACFSIGSMLIAPFVMLYTDGITDADYFRPIFGILLMIAEGIYVLRSPYVNLAYSANKFKDITRHAVIEVLINILLSLILVPSLGIIGVAIGTITAMAYRTAYQIIYLRKNIIKRPFMKFLKRFVIFVIATALAVCVCIAITIESITTFTIWAKYAIIYTLIFGIVYSLISILFFRKELSGLKKYLRGK